MAVNSLTHLDDQGQPRMVDISDKSITSRTAVASCLVDLGTDLMSEFEDGDLLTKKGSVIQTAIIAGIMGAKKTPELIPMCHPISLEKVKIEITPYDGTCLIIKCTCKITSKTGVEMEALTGATTAALTIYDMCKSINPAIVVRETKLMEKTGGKSDFNA